MKGIYPVAKNLFSREDLSDLSENTQNKIRKGNVNHSVGATILYLFGLQNVLCIDDLLIGLERRLGISFERKKLYGHVMRLKRSGILTTSVYSRGYYQLTEKGQAVLKSENSPGQSDER